MDFEKIFKQCVIDNKNDICRIIDIDKDKKSIADFQFKKFPDSFKIEDYTFLKPDKVDSLPDEEGVYVFVAKKEIEFNLAEVFYKFILLDSSLSEHFVCTPSLNCLESEFNQIDKIKIKIHEKEIIYAGEAKNIKTRVKAHLDDKLNKTNSMKFGLRKDIFITDSYDIYYCVTLDRTKLESIIHNDYHTRFGE